jgi:hypothetical protein
MNPPDAIRFANCKLRINGINDLINLTKRLGNNPYLWEEDKNSRSLFTEHYQLRLRISHCCPLVNHWMSTVAAGSFVCIYLAPTA